MKAFCTYCRPCEGWDPFHLRYESPPSRGRQLSKFRSTHSNGFTLIEILVVILIVGITLSFALIAFGDFGEKRRIVVATEQFNNYAKLVQQQAILETSTLGIAINKNGYQILRFQRPGTWVPMSSRHIFHDQHFPNGLLINLRNVTTKRGTPTIIINSSGNMTPFVLDFGSSKQAVITTIVGKENGELQMVTAP